MNNVKATLDNSIHHSNQQQKHPHTQSHTQTHSIRRSEDIDGSDGCDRSLSSTGIKSEIGLDIKKRKKIGSGMNAMEKTSILKEAQQDRDHKRARRENLQSDFIETQTGKHLFRPSVRNKTINQHNKNLRLNSSRLSFTPDE